ncbi:hypothetical protein CHH86_06325 [Bacillus paralicheniformis]|nr:hypothetical protein CHH86_06325 [Bacillus paralicheniformis]PAE05345.1 hypothetical protein CHI13_03660 [Bacillus paralicheniformis]
MKKECPHFTPLRKISVPNCCNTAHFHNQSQVLQVAPYCSPVFLKKPVFPEHAVKNNAFTHTFLL